MSAQWVRIVAGVCLAGLAWGCKVPPVPDHVRNNPDYRPGVSDKDEYDGWLWRRLTGQTTDTQAAESAATRMGTSSGARQASATEPASATPGPAPGETVVTPALAAAATSSKSDEDEEKTILDSLSPSNLYKQVKTLAGYGPNEQVARQAYQQGQRLFDEKRYDEAAKQFATAADRWPDSPLEEDALFMYAESLFFSDQYAKAEDAYEKLLKKYQYSRYVDKAVARQFAIGRYWEQFHAAEPHWPITPNFGDKTRPMFDTWGYALKCYEHVRLNDPTGPLADDSLMATATAYYNRGRFEDAAFHYDLLRKEYPKSEHAMNASLLCLDAKQRIYQGPLYDGTPLRDADEVADQTLTRFGPALGEKRGLVLDTKNQIVEQKAEREWAMAQYYDKNHYYGAARFYYQSLVDEYPNTRYGEAARQRLAQIKDLPAEPPDRFGWLNKIVNPKKRRTSPGGASAASGPTVAGSGGG
ncbi:MAG: outer membrane protein assembly factor BamD [Thermoguttaceae bacterium]|nr:outer membrane protein assembly factor BamD [Thermoguttaceae bacterium]